MGVRPPPCSLDNTGRTLYERDVRQLLDKFVEYCELLEPAHDKWKRVPFNVLIRPLRVGCSEPNNKNNYDNTYYNYHNYGM